MAVLFRLISLIIVVIVFNTSTLAGAEFGHSKEESVMLDVVINLGDPDTMICAGDTIILATTVTGGDGNYTYEWSPGTGLSSITDPAVEAFPLASTVFTVTVTDGTGTTGTATISITVKPVPVMTVTPLFQEICSGGTTSIQMTSNLTGTQYSWTVSAPGISGANPGAGNTITQLLSVADFESKTATYVITPILNGCPGLPDTVEVVVHPIPDLTVDAAGTDICSGNSPYITLSSNVSNAVFSWSVLQNGTSGAFSGSGSLIDQSLTATGSAAGTVVYTVTAESNGCTSSSQITITVNPIPVISGTPSNYTICSGSTTSINLVSDVAGATFSWTSNASGVSGSSDGSGSIIAQTLNTTQNLDGEVVYYITPSANGCDAASPYEVTVTVTQLPEATIVYDGPFCSNDGGLYLPIVNGVGNYTGGTYASVPLGLNINGLTGGIIPATSAAGNYTVQYTIPAGGGCPVIVEAVAVSITALPTASLAYAGLPYCETDAVPHFPVLSGTGSYTGGTFAASPAGLVLDVTTGIVIASGSVPGLYTITYTTNSFGGCPEVTAMTTVEIFALPDPMIDYPGTPYCSNQGSAGVTLTGATGGAYSGPSGLFINSVTGAVNLGFSLPGTYTVTYSTTPQGGCPSVQTTATITITEFPFSTIIYPIGPFCPNADPKIPVITGNTTGTFSSQAGIDLDPFSGVIYPASSNQGSYIISYTIPAADGCDEVEYTTNVTIDDIQLPILTVPGNVFVTCLDEADPSASGTATATDNCTVNPVISYTDAVIPGNCEDRRSITRTWLATDENGNSSTKNQVINVGDYTPPSIVCPPNITVNTPDDIPDIDINSVSSSDNCGKPVVLALKSQEYVFTNQPGFCPESVVRTYTSTDNCGNISSCQQNITIADLSDCPICQSTVPFYSILFDGPESDTAFYDVSRRGQCCKIKQSPPPTCVTFNIRLHPDAVGLIIKVDGAIPSPQEWRIDCDPITITQSGIICIPGGIYHAFTYCKPGANLNDFTFESIPGPSAPDIETRVECNGQVSVTGLDPSTKVQVFIDQEPANICEDTPPVITAFASPLNSQFNYFWYNGPNGTGTQVGSGDMYVPIGQGQFSVIAQELNSRFTCFSDTLNFTVTFDQSGPSDVIVPPDLILECNSPVSASLINAWLKKALAYDGTILLPVSHDYVPVTPYCGLVQTVQFSAVDSCDNVTPDFGYIRYLDNTPPSITCPPFQNLSCASELPPVAGTFLQFTGQGGSIVDLCDPEPDVMWLNDVRDNNNCPDNFNLTRSYLVTDDCGNSTTCVQNIRVNNVSPLSVPSNGSQIVECLQDAVIPVPPDVDDGCGNQITPVMTVGPDPSCDGTKIYTFTYSACSGLSTTWYYNYIIDYVDFSVPADPAPVTVSCFAEAIVPSPPVVSDNCGINLVPAGPVIQESFNGCSGFRNFTFTYEDCSRNKHEWVYRYNITDTESPQWAQQMPTDIIVECDAIPVVPVILGTDNCVANVVFNETKTPGPCPHEYELLRQWTLTDQCSNTIVHVQTIQVEDNISPVIDCPGDVTVSCESGLPLPDIMSVVVSNNCGTYVVTHEGTTNLTNFECGGDVVRTYLVTDECNNTASCAQIISILPSSQAQFVNPPSNAVLACSDAAIFQATDLEYTNQSSGDCLIEGTVTGIVTGSVAACGGSLVQTWTFTDDCGRVISHTQTLTIEPTIEPQWISAPQDITITCDQATSFLPLTLQYSNGLSGICGIEGSVVGVVTGSYNECGGSLTQTWTFTDVCNRIITHTQNIAVEAAPKPDWINTPPDITISCDEARSFTFSTLTYSNSGTSGCLLEGTADGQVVGEFDECGGVLNQIW